MVMQIVRVSIRAEKRDRWLELIRANARQTRAEEGCEGYQVGEDIEMPNIFVVVEHWASMKAQYDHFRNPELRELLASLTDVLAGPPEVAVHQVASTQTLDEALAAAGVGGKKS